MIDVRRLCRSFAWCRSRAEPAETFSPVRFSAVRENISPLDYFAYWFQPPMYSHFITMDDADDAVDDELMMPWLRRQRCRYWCRCRWWLFRRQPIDDLIIGRKWLSHWCKYHWWWCDVAVSRIYRTFRGSSSPMIFEIRPYVKYRWFSSKRGRFQK